jgi:hypothetical protein
MKTKLILTVIICAVAFTACKKKKEDVPAVTPVTKKVYVVGYDENNAGTRTGRFWIDTSANSLAVNNADVELEDIAVVGNDRYIFGQVDPHASGSTSKFIIWKNGTILHEIPYDNSFIPERMAVSGTDVYLCGYRYLPTTNTSQPALWKNGTVSILSQGYTNASLSRIYVAGSTVYAAGYEYSSGANQYYFSVWTNGTRQVIHTGGGGVLGITVSGTDVYVVGADNNSNPVYWKNGTKVTLPVTAGATGIATGIVIEGTDVYASGDEYEPGLPSKPLYWKNGVKTNLSTGNTSYNGYTTGVAVDGTNVYVCGSADRNSNGDYSAVIWKNGVLNNLTPSSYEAYANTVIIK